MNILARFLMLIGGVIMIVGVLLLIFGKIPYLGKFPGDIVIKRENITIYFPITTSVIVSIILTLLLRLIIKK